MRALPWFGVTAVEREPWLAPNAHQARGGRLLLGSVGCWLGS